MKDKTKRPSKKNSNKYHREYYHNKLKNDPKFIEKRKERDKQRYYGDKEKAKQKYLKYMQKPGTKKRKLENHREWVKNNIKHVRNERNRYGRIRKKNDKSFKIKSNLRTRFWFVLQKYSSTSGEIVSKKYGINYTQIVEHLKPFPQDIENYHIDHVIPLSKFDFNNLSHIKIAFAPKNHQWLTKEQNMIKGNKLVHQDFK